MASWIPGLGESKPQARKLLKSFFGYVPDDGSVDIFDKKADKPAEAPHQVQCTRFKLIRFSLERKYVFMPDSFNNLACF